MGYKKLCKETPTAQEKAVELDLGQHLFYNLILKETTMRYKVFSVCAMWFSKPSISWLSLTDKII